VVPDGIVMQMNCRNQIRVLLLFLQTAEGIVLKSKEPLDFWEVYIKQVPGLAMLLQLIAQNLPQSLKDKLAWFI
jgi:hypothetical protein